MSAADQLNRYRVRITDTVLPGTSPVRLVPFEGGSYVFIRSGDPSRFRLEHDLSITLRTAQQLRNDGYEVIELEPEPEPTARPSRRTRRRR